MKADIWMPLYVADYLADTNRLTTAQHGAYLLLLMDYWRNGALPNDDAVLAQICKMTPDAWSIARSVLEQFFSIDETHWRNKRSDEEMIKAGINKKAAHDKAVKAAEAKWAKVRAAQALLGELPEAMLEQCPSPSPSPSPSKESNSKAIAINKLNCPHDEIIKLYHEILPSCPSIRDWTPARQSLLRARWNESEDRQNVDYWRGLFEYIAKIPFLTGQVSTTGRKPFFASLDWIVKAENFAKIREGRYD